jgi:hypothetical protein
VSERVREKVHGRVRERCRRVCRRGCTFIHPDVKLLILCLEDAAAMWPELMVTSSSLSLVVSVEKEVPVDQLLLLLRTHLSMHIKLALQVGLLALVHRTTNSVEDLDARLLGACGV